MSEENKENEPARNAKEPSYRLPILLIGGGLLLEAVSKPVAKSMSTGLQQMANIQGTFAIISAIGIVTGIGFLIRTILARRKKAGG